MSEKEYSVLQTLPDDGMRCLCFGHKTYCCKKDMEKEPGWHEVVFKFDVYKYRLKDSLPEDPEHSVLKEYSVCERWNIPSYEDCPEHVLGVTKWKRI